MREVTSSPFLIRSQFLKKNLKILINSESFMKRDVTVEEGRRDEF